VDCIRIDQVAAALKKMKRHKATGDIEKQWILLPSVL